MNHRPATSSQVQSGRHSAPLPIDTAVQTNTVPEQPGLLVAALAHEVRNPLTNIDLSLGMLEALLNREEHKMYLDVIRRSSVRISDLINEVLKYSQADEVCTESYSAHDMLDEVLEMAQDRIKLKRVKVYKDYGITDCAIMAHKTKMKLAFTNIIINAIEAMSGQNCQLKITTSSIAHKFIVQIRDNGCGISKNDLDNIFSPYFSNKPGGLGLGLAATYNILKSHNIAVNVESKEGKGTNFILLFDRNCCV